MGETPDGVGLRHIAEVFRCLDGGFVVAALGIHASSVGEVSLGLLAQRSDYILTGGGRVSKGDVGRGGELIGGEGWYNPEF